MKWILNLLFCCVISQFFAQQNFVLEITCTELNSGNLVQNAIVTCQQGDSTIVLKSNRQGEVFWKIHQLTTLDVEITHGYYETIFQKLVLPKGANDGDTIRKKIELQKQKVKQLGEVVVLAPGAVQVVFQSERLSVSDFELLPSGELLLLAYPKRLDKGSELLIYNGKEIVQSFNLKENPMELIHDFRGNPHVVCEKGVYGIYRDKYSVGISNIDKSYYMKYIFPVVDTVQTKLFFSNFNPNYPAFDYMAFDQLDSAYLKIMEIKDDLMMELYRSEYKWVDVRTKLWAANKELETGVDKEIWVGANYFTNSIYYKQLYAPMFQKEDTIYVFDYYKDLLFSFNKFGNKLDSIPIFHHYEPKQTGWKRMLVQDDVTGTVFAFFEKDGICSIQSIDLKTGKLGDKIQFSHKYVEKLAISGSRAYYIYRPFESAQKKFLYMTQLPIK